MPAGDRRPTPGGVAGGGDLPRLHAAGSPVRTPPASVENGRVPAPARPLVPPFLRFYGADKVHARGPESYGGRALCGDGLYRAVWKLVIMQSVPHHGPPTCPMCLRMMGYRDETLPPPRKLRPLAQHPRRKK